MLTFLYFRILGVSTKHWNSIC